MKTTALLIITYLCVIVNPFELLAQDKIEVRAWQLHHPDIPYCKKVMDLAPEYNINTIVLSHAIIGAASDLYNTSARSGSEGRAEGIKELIDYGKLKGLKIWIWVHELSDLPDKFLEKTEEQDPSSSKSKGIALIDKPGFWKWLENRYDKLYKDFPEIDGAMLTFHETQYKIFDDNQVRSKLSKPDRFQKMINAIYKASESHEKELIIRTFVYEPEQLKWIREGIEKTNDNVIVQSKCVPHDWQPFYPHNPVIGTFEGKRQIIEFDCSSEYTGRNHIPYTSPEYFSYRWKYNLSVDQVIGYNARLDHAGYDALFTPNEINLYTLYQLTENPSFSPDEIWFKWASKKYGEEVAPIIIDVLKPSFDVVNKLFFPKGVWFTNHSKLPPYNYASSHINFINKWYEDEYLEITKKLHDPDINTFMQLLAEKDTAIISIQKSLWRLTEAKDLLSDSDYYTLQEQLILLMQTGLIWKNHTTAFFGLKLVDRYPELEFLISNAINNIRMLANTIPESQIQKPVADKQVILNVANELEQRFRN